MSVFTSVLYVVCGYCDCYIFISVGLIISLNYHTIFGTGIRAILSTRRQRLTWTDWWKYLICIKIWKVNYWREECFGLMTVMLIHQLCLGLITNYCPGCRIWIYSTLYAITTIWHIECQKWSFVEEECFFKWQNFTVITKPDISRWSLNKECNPTNTSVQ